MRKDEILVQESMVSSRWPLSYIPMLRKQGEMLKMSDSFKEHWSLPGGCFTVFRKILLAEWLMASVCHRQEASM